MRFVVRRYAGNNNVAWLLRLSLLFCVVKCGVAWAAVPVNGDFEDGLNGWTVEGAVSVDPTPGNHVAYFQENPEGAVSRIHQVFDLPGGPLTLTFKLYIDPDGRAAGGDDRPRGKLTKETVAKFLKAPERPLYRRFVDPPTDPLRDFPPDSFSAFLLDPATQERLLPPPGVPPTEYDEFFYIDNTGLIDFNGDYVTVSEQDAEGVRTVTLDLSSLPSGQPVHLEFGLAGGPDGVTTFAMLDDVVVVSCPFDVNENGRVDTGDYAFFLSCFATQVGPGDACFCFDVNLNGEIDTDDYAEVLGCLAQFCPCP